jgi:hypothetical protein
MTLELLPLRLEFYVRREIRFPAGKAGNILRGALGLQLDSNLFRPARKNGPSGLKEPPRPFVLRVAGLDGRVFAAGQRFGFGVNIFDTRDRTAAVLMDALQRAVSSGFGPGEGAADLVAASGLEVLSLDLDPGSEAASRLAVRFLTPTELKARGVVSEEPRFGDLMARIRDRVSSLRAIYGSGPLQIDFLALGRRASAVKTARCIVRQVTVERRSSRTGQTHPVGGFIGEAEYDGDLGEFLPLLRAACFTGVGRHTVWGNGEIAVSKIA